MLSTDSPTANVEKSGVAASIASDRLANMANSSGDTRRPQAQGLCIR